MPDLYGYDFSDDLIRDLVRRNHTPIEEVVTSAEGTVLRPVLCGQCRAHWPCEPIIGLRTWQHDHGYDVAATDTSVQAEG